MDTFYVVANFSRNLDHRYLTRSYKYVSGIDQKISLWKFQVFWASKIGEEDTFPTKLPNLNKTNIKFLTNFTGKP